MQNKGFMLLSLPHRLHHAQISPDPVPKTLQVGIRILPPSGGMSFSAKLQHPIILAMERGATS